MFQQQTPNSKQQTTNNKQQATSNKQQKIQTFFTYFAICNNI